MHKHTLLATEQEDVDEMPEQHKKLKKKTFLNYMHQLPQGEVERLI
jgi:hypothetical protein